MKTFRILSPYELDLPLDVTFYLQEVPLQKVVEASASWMVANQNKYIGKKEWKETFSALSKTSDVAAHSDLLSTFYAAFLNNPYIFENRLFDTKQADKICSRHIVCYFVVFRDILVPIGALQNFVSEEVFCEIISAFLKERLEKCKALVKEDTELCRECERIIGTRNGIKSAVYQIKTLSYGMMLVLSVLFVRKWLVLGIDWKNFSAIFERSGSFFPALGFLAEEGYRINHNSWLIYVLFLLAAIWAVIALCSIAPFFRSAVWGKRYANRRQCYRKSKYMEKKLRSFVESSENELQKLPSLKFDEFLAIQTDSKHHTKLFCRAKAVTRFLTKLEQGRIPAGRRVSFSQLTGPLLLMVLALASFSLSSASTEAEFVDKANLQVQKIQRFYDGRRIRAEKEYRVKRNTYVYTKPTEDSLVLYELTPEHLYSIVDDSEETMKKVRFFTEYGYLSGWVSNPSSTLYTVGDDPTMERIAPIDAIASHTDHGDTQKLFDNNSYTAWGISGESGSIGEYAELQFPEVTPVDAIMIQTGNRFFGTNSRPISYRIEFICADQTEETLTVTLEDSSKKQSFRLNRSVSADKVRFVILEVAQGSIYDDLYIAELAVYQKAAVED